MARIYFYKMGKSSILTARILYSVRISCQTISFLLRVKKQGRFDPNIKFNFQTVCISHKEAPIFNSPVTQLITILVAKVFKFLLTQHHVHISPFLTIIIWQY